MTNYAHPLPAACERGCGQKAHGDAGCGAIRVARAFGRHDPLEEIQWGLSFKAWDADACKAIAEILRAAGYEVRA